MADERIDEAKPGVVETTDRGLFDFMKKKEDETKPATSEYDNINSGVEKVHISEPEYKKKDHHQHHEEKKHESLGEKLHHYDSSSSSDEEGDDEEKKRRRKERKEKKKGGIKEKIEEKFGGHHKEEHHEHDTNVPIEKIHVQENVYSEPSYTAMHAPDHHHHHQEEKKKGEFMDKIKDKLPGQHSDEEHKVAAPVVSHTEEGHHGSYVQENVYSEPSYTATHAPDHHHQEEKKKGEFMDKIKDKLPGQHGDEKHKVAAPVVSHTEEGHHGTEEEKEKEKKGLLDKIKEKIPGFHSKNGAEEKKEHDHHEDKKEGY